MSDNYDGCSDRLLNLAALEAACAAVRPLRLSAQENADALEVRVEAALRGDHRVAPVVPEAGLLPADCAHLRHGGRQCSGARPLAPRAGRAQLREDVCHL